MNEIIVTDESVTVNGRMVEHNEHRWQSKTNRHTETSGSSWGWIDGPPKSVCWSDDERFNSVAATAMARAHNEWLDAQQPLPIKIIKAKREYAAALAEFNDINTKHSAALAKMNNARLALDNLRALQGASHVHN